MRETENLLKQFLTENPLFVFALPEEAGNEFKDDNVLITGVGKVNAAYALTKKLHEGDKPGILVNLGSAGSAVYKRDEVVCCTRFIQRDMDATPLGFELYKTPFSAIPPVIEHGFKIKGCETAICGSGDKFEGNHSTDKYNVVDMEAYSLAFIAKERRIPFLCLKYITDGANGSAGTDWQSTLHQVAVALKQKLNGLK